jgi:gas vesicle protein
MNNSRSGISLLAGFLLGAAIGALAALVVAPQAGQQTRQQLKERTIELRGHAQEPSSGRHDQADDQATD